MTVTESPGPCLGIPPLRRPECPPKALPEKHMPLDAAFYDRLIRVPPYASFATPETGSTIILFTVSNDAATAITRLKDAYTIAYICIADNPQVKEVCGIKNIRTADRHLMSGLIVFYLSDMSNIWRICDCIEFMLKNRFFSFIFYTCQGHVHSPRRIMPHDFFEKHSNEMAAAYSLLEDEESKDIFIRFLKTKLTGSLGYMKKTMPGDYYHPLCHAQPGDVIFDGGISGHVGAQKAFLRQIGRQGRMFCFEPDPESYKGAKAAIQRFDLYRQITLYPLGLYSENAFLDITDDGDSSTVMDGGSNTKKNSCKVVQLDDFLSRNDFDRMDLLKLDVEGAELHCLRGAREAIQKFRPKMMICLYHLQEDIFTLIHFVHDLNLGYTFYLGTETCFPIGLVLFCVPPEKAC